ncbi:MAG: PKD domain-containing protein [Gammaproteobacteria bacterium]
MKCILALLLFLSPAVQAIVIDNGIPAGTEGHFSVDVLAGGDTENATITARRSDTGALTTTDVVFQYTSFVDPGQDGGGIPLSASQILQEPTPNPNDPNTVTSSGIFSGQSGQVFWEATSSIRPGSQVMTTRYLFSALGDDPIGSLRVLQYLDEDVNPVEDDEPGFRDNVFLPLGSADFGDLSLYTFGNPEVIGVRQAGSESVESFFAGWATAPFPDILGQIQGSGQPIAREGVINLPPINHPRLGPSFGPADITSVLAWDINPNTFFAEVITVLGGEDAAPVPPVASFVATPASGIAPLAVAFNGSGSTDSDGQIVRYRWDFGDGTFAEGPRPTHTYTVPGTFSAQLVVRDDSGLVGSSIQQIGVAAPLPPPPPPPGPPPVTPANPGDPIVCQGRACGVPLTCNLLDAQCTTEATIFVRARGGRANGDAAVRAPRTIRLASSVANIPPRQTAIVRPRLTKRGKGLLQASRAGGKKRFNGTLQLRNVVTGAVISSTPITVRLR